MFSPEIQNFIDAFSKLPAIGPRMATRLAFYVTSLGTNEQEALASALEKLKNLDRCPQCFFIKQKKQNLCEFCRDKRRDPYTIAIVEKDTDVLSIEKAGKFGGIYCVIGELDHRNPLGEIQKQRLQKLKNHISQNFKNNSGEVIIALSPNTFGDFVAELIKQGLKESKVKVTRIGRGIPTGGEVEFSDEETLRSSFDSRR